MESCGVIIVILITIGLYKSMVYHVNVIFKPCRWCAAILSWYESSSLSSSYLCSICQKKLRNCNRLRYIPR